MRLTYKDKNGVHLNGMPPICVPADANRIMTDAVDKLAAYEDAEEQGRLVMLPVKPGDYLYRKYNSGMQVYTVYNVQVRADHFWINVIQKEPPTLYPFRDYLDGHDIGKTVFLTREEAEAALKGERKADGG